MGDDEEPPQFDGEEITKMSANEDDSDGEE